MDLGKDCNRGQKDEILEKNSILDGEKGGINGGSASEVAKPAKDGIEAEAGDESPSTLMGTAKVDSCDAAAAKPAVAKGFGLKKWRRIRRETNKEGSTSVDSTLIHKRRLSGAEAPKARDESKVKDDVASEVEVEAEGEGSAASLELRGTATAPVEIAAGSLGPELELLVTSSGFSVGADSENSEERGSKSSTAASALRPRHETGFGRDRTRVKACGRGSGHVVQQKARRGRGGSIESNKNISSDQVIFEKENSFSSVESSLRSRGSLNRHVKQSERTLNFDCEQSDEDLASEEVKSGCYKENGRIESLEADAAEESVKISEHSQPQSDVDPLVESIMLLQAAQEALENEIQKFTAIATEPAAKLDGQFDEIEESSSPSLEAHLIELNEKIDHLEQKLEEASATVKAKELKVLELEAMLSGIQPSKKETGSRDSRSLQDECKLIELELESLLQTKMEAEVEYLTITSTTQSTILLAKDQIAHFEEQKSLLKDQSQMILKLRDAEDTVVMLKENVQKLEASCKELLSAEEVLKLQNDVCRFSTSCFAQFLMFCIAMALFLLHLLPISDGVVPT